MLVAPVALFAAGVEAAAKGRMSLCIHSNTSNGAGYRKALEGWAKAGIKQVELNAPFVEAFIKTDTLDGARKVLADNGLTLVHGAVAVNGLIEPNPNHATALDNLKRRCEMFSEFGLKKVYTTAGGTEKIPEDAYQVVVQQMRAVGETVKGFGMICSVECIRSSPFMSTILTGLKYTREAAHPNFGLMFDFYHFCSGMNRLEDLDQIRPGEITHVHFQDVPDMPRELLDNNTRIIPGDGVSPIVPMLQKLAAKGYAGPLSVELFLPKFRDGDPFAVAQEIRRKCDAVMRRARVV